MTLTSTRSGPGGAGWRYLDPADLKRLRNFQFAARLIVEGFFYGRHRSPFHDLSAEFADYRAYTPGDEIRALDWRAVARTDRLYIRLFRKETDMNCYLLVDVSPSMRFADPGASGGGGLTKLEYASYLSAALAYLMVQQGDRVALALADTGLREFLPAGGSDDNLRRILSTLERLPHGESVASGSGLAVTLRTLSGVLKRKGLLVVLSDFLDDPESLFRSLGMFTHRGFAVLLIQILTEAELHLPEAEAALFHDPETHLEAAAEPAAIRQAYEAELRAYLQNIESNCHARRIHYQLASTRNPYHEALESYLTKRLRL